MKEEIAHRGKVVRMTPQGTTVAILQHGACGSCHAAGLCGMADLAEKTVEVPADRHASYAVGDEVDVVLKASMGFKAVWLAYFIPLLLLLAVVLGGMALGLQGLPAALIGLAVLALYYLGLYLLRDGLKNEYVFKIVDSSLRSE